MSNHVCELDCGCGRIAPPHDSKAGWARALAIKTFPWDNEWRDKIELALLEAREMDAPLLREAQQALDHERWCVNCAESCRDCDEGCTYEAVSEKLKARLGEKK